MADDVRAPEPGQPAPGTPPAPDVTATHEFDPTLAPPADPYVDDTSVGVVPVYPPEYPPDPAQPAEPADTGPVTRAGQPGDQRWSARAGVPVPGTREPVPAEPPWAGPPPRQGVWWTPLLLGLLVVLLVVLLGLGLWLGLRGTGGGTGSPSPTPTPPVATSGVPSRTAASSAPPSASAATFVLPDLTGASAADATALLTAAGLKVVQEPKVDGSVPAGQVLGTSPGPGTAVPLGGTVTLIVAAAAPSSAPPPPPSPSPSASASG